MTSVVGLEFGLSRLPFDAAPVLNPSGVAFEIAQVERKRNPEDFAGNSERVPSRGRSNPRVSPGANSNATPLGFSVGGFAFIPTHGPNSQNFNCGVILPVLAAPFEPNSRPHTEAVGYFISPSEFETTS